MEKQLKGAIDYWMTSKSELTEKRQASIQKNKLLQGEYIVRLEVQEELLVCGERVSIKQSRDFYTLSQTESSFFQNPEGDLNRFQNCSEKLDREFSEHREARIKDIIETKLNPNPELKPAQ